MLLFGSFPALDWHLLVWVACAPLVAALMCEPRPARAFILAHLSGAVFMGGSCQWFIDVLEIHGGLSTALATFALLLFLLVYPIIFGLFGLALWWAGRRSLPLALALSPFLWVTLELGRTYWMTGFPWNLLGYAVEAVGLRQLASVAGVYGLSFLAFTTSVGIAWLGLEPRRRSAPWAVAAWLAMLAAANWVLMPPRLAPSAGSDRIGAGVASLVQPNVPLDAEGAARWAPWRDPRPLEELVALSVASVERQGTGVSRPALIIWPENSAPFYFERDPIFRRAVEQMARASRSYVVVGTVNYTDGEPSKPTNSAVVLNPEGRVVLTYDKIHLVPFGEYVPRWALPGLVGKITHEAGDFVPGSEYRSAETPHGALAVFICYEAIFPQLVRRLTPQGPGVLVNISNDAWFGDTAAPSQHFAMARLRAIETGRYLLRATNDGITAVIDPQGRVLGQLPRHQVSVLVGRFDFLAGRTLYAAYGDVFAWLGAAVSLLLLAREAVIRRNEQRKQTKKV